MKLTINYIKNTKEYCLKNKITFTTLLVPKKTIIPIYVKKYAKKNGIDVKKDQFLIKNLEDSYTLTAGYIGKI